mmetsp:Transcript_13811/g.27528  ORF Transcript_13811/g.27528 Transcript_13811/m.27528 type:complete len:125 (-) Transcript_13811:39-413(-)
MSLPNMSSTSKIENDDTTPNEVPPADLRTSRPCNQPDLQPRAQQPTMPAQARGFQPPANLIQPCARQPTMPAQARGTITPAMRSIRTTLFPRVLTLAEHDALMEERDRYINNFEEWASNLESDY